MKKDADELDLNNDYEFEIWLKHEANVFFGKLHLTPTKITLYISADTTTERQLPPLYSDVDELKCTTLTKLFILKDLRFEQDSWRHLQAGISHVEKVYDVGYVVFMPNIQDNNEPQATHVRMQSNDISKWIGFTEKQQALLDHQNDPAFIFNQLNATEFHQPIENIGALSATYNVRLYNDTTGYQAGISYVPNISFQTKIPKTIVEAKKNIDMLYNFFAFLIGRDFSLQKVNMYFNPPHQKAFLYFPSMVTKSQRNSDNVFFGLGRHPFPHLPEFPIQAFDTYFQLDSKTQNFWPKYLKYKRMDSWEERFLGYFRLLESLCRIKKSYINEEQLESTLNVIKEHLKTKYEISFTSSKSFVKAIGATNGLKYNVEKCLTEFYSKLPKQLMSKIIFDESDFLSICALRNDITHANDFYIDENELIRKTLFVEFLLVLAMCEKIGIDYSILEHIMFKHKSFPSIQRYD